MENKKQVFVGKDQFQGTKVTWMSKKGSKIYKKYRRILWGDFPAIHRIIIIEKNWKSLLVFQTVVGEMGLIFCCRLFLRS